jgi:hypothetical protein
MSINWSGRMPPEVKTVFDAVCSTVCDIYCYWRFHVELCGNPQDVNLMQDILLVPFHLIRRAFLTTVTMGVGRILDPAVQGPNANLSFDRLLAALRPGHATLHARPEPMLADAKRLCIPILTWRNKRFGHADMPIGLGTAADPLPEIDQRAFEVALASLRRVLEETYCHFNPGAQMPFQDMAGSAEAMMRYIRRGREAEIADNGEFLP